MGRQILVDFIGPPRGSPEPKIRAKPVNLSKIGVLDFAQLLKKCLTDPDGAKNLSGFPILPVDPPVDPIVPLATERNIEPSDFHSQAPEPVKPDDNSQRFQKSAGAHVLSSNAMAKPVLFQIVAEAEGLQLSPIRSRESHSSKTPIGVKRPDDVGGGKDDENSHVTGPNKVVSLKSARIGFAGVMNLKMFKNEPPVDSYLHRSVVYSEDSEKCDSPMANVDDKVEILMAVAGEPVVVKEPVGLSDRVANVAHNQTTNIGPKGRLATLRRLVWVNSLSEGKSVADPTPYGKGDPLSDLAQEELPQSREDDLVSEVANARQGLHTTTNPVAQQPIPEIFSAQQRQEVRSGKDGTNEEKMNAEKDSVPLQSEIRSKIEKRFLHQRAKFTDSSGFTVRVKASKLERVTPEVFKRDLNDGYLKVKHASREIHPAVKRHINGDLKLSNGEDHHYVWVAMPKLESEKVVTNANGGVRDLEHLPFEHTSRRLAQVVVKWANTNVQRVPASAEMEVKGIGLLKMSLSYDKHLGGLKLEIRITQPFGAERVLTQVDLKAAEQMIRDGLNRMGILSVSVRFESGAGSTMQQMSGSSSPGRGGIGNPTGQGAGQSSYQMMREMVNLLAHLKRERKGE